MPVVRKNLGQVLGSLLFVMNACLTHLGKEDSRKLGELGGVWIGCEKLGNIVSMCWKKWLLG